MSAIFISHSSADKEVAARLRDQLDAGGFKSVFVDFDKEKGILPGQRWEETLYRNIRSCQAVIALVSKSWSDSSWCQTEVRQARALHKTIFPVLLDGSGFGSLGDVQFAKLTTPASVDDCASLLRGLDVAKVSRGAWDHTRPPYPGLLSFEEKDAGVFFGREMAIESALSHFDECARRRKPPWFVLLGASGAGKSSLLQAGLLPKLRSDPQSRWLVVGPFRRGKDPFDGLTSAWSTALGSFGRACDPLELKKVLRSGDVAKLADLASDLRLVATKTEATIALVIDQFEEFLLKNGSAGQEGDGATAFLALLRTMSEWPSSPFVVLATLRADFLGAFQTHPALRGLATEEFVVKPLDDEELPRVITEPAVLAGVAFEEGLVDEMVRDTRDGNALPLLAFALRELYEGFADDGFIERHEYREGLGGLKKAIARRAEAVLEKLQGEGSPEAEQELRRAFLSLVQPGDEGRPVRRAVRWSALSESARAKLEKFVTARLLVSGGEDEAVIEVAHEALFRSWPKLESWIRENREFLAWRKRLDPLVDAWTETSKSKTKLLNRPELGEAESWLTKEGRLLSERERNYIATSLRVEKARKWWGRIAVAVTFLLVVALAIVTAQQRDIAARQRDISEAGRKIATARLLVAQSVASSSPDAALLLALEANASVDNFETRGALIRALVATSDIAYYLHGPMNGVHDVTFSPDGKFVAGSGGGDVHVWSTASRSLVRTYGAGLSVKGIPKGQVFSPHRNVFATYSFFNVFVAERFDPSGPESPGAENAPSPGGLYESGGQVSDIAYHPREHVLAFASCTSDCAKGSRVELWDTDRHVRFELLEAGGSANTTLSFNRNGEKLAAAGRSGAIVVWDWAKRARPDKLLVGSSSIEQVVFSRRSDLLAYTTQHDVGLVTSLRDRSNRQFPHSARVNKIALSPDDTTLVTGDQAGDLRFWNLHAFPLQARVRHLGRPVNGLAFGPTSHDLVVSSNGGPVALLRMGEGFAVERQACENSWGTATAYSAPAGLIAVGCSNGKVVLFRMSPWPTLEKTFVAHGGSVNALAFVAAGDQLATLGCSDGIGPHCPSELRLWSTRTHTELAPAVATGIERPSTMTAAAGMIATGTLHGEVHLWDANNLQAAGLLTTGHETPITNVLFAPDGSSVFALSDVREISEWDPRERILRRGLRMARLLGLSSAGVSPTANKLAMAGYGFVELFDLKQVDSNLNATMEGHESSINGVAFIDESSLATAGDDGSVVLWDLNDSKMVGALFRRESRQRGLVFATKERLVASVGDDGILTVAPVDLDVWRRRACEVANRNLSLSEWEHAHPGASYRRSCPDLPAYGSVILRPSATSQPAAPPEDAGP